MPPPEFEGVGLAVGEELADGVGDAVGLGGVAAT